jgi:hypothetical protein
MGLLPAFASPTYGTIHELTKNVSVTVVPRVLLDHVHVDPSQRTRFAMTQPVSSSACAAAAARLASHSACHDATSASQSSVIERNEFAVLDVRVAPDPSAVVDQQCAPEPAAFDFGHMTQQSVQ